MVDFPLLGWQSSLSRLPTVTMDVIREYHEERSSTERQMERSYNFLAESYVDTESVKANYSKECAGNIYVKAKCYRSKKKTAQPYSVAVALDTRGKVVAGRCDCPAGVGSCNHLLGVLRTVMLLQEKGFSEAPGQLSVTDMPQRWRVTRGRQVKGTSVQVVDWRSVREGELENPITCRLYDVRRNPGSFTAQKTAIASFGETLYRLNEGSMFGRSLLCMDDEAPCKKTKLGPASVLSPMVYQQSLLPFGFDVLVSPNIAASNGNIQKVPQDHKPFVDSQIWTVSHNLKGNEILEKLQLSPEAAQSLERDTRQQAKGETWFKERRLRLTASNFGLVMQRKQWTIKGLRALTQKKDLSRVRAVRYGIVNDPIAAQRYEEVLRTRGHNAALTTCGLFVDPSAPWLGATPDRIVFDPTEDEPHGVVEIQCPYTLADKKLEQLKDEVFCSTVDENTTTLKRDHTYYYQILGQMAISGLPWGNFVMYGKNYILIERIRFCSEDWDAVQDKLKEFYFDVMVPHLQKEATNV